MINITFATTSKGKFTSAQRVLKKYDITVHQADMELPESQSSLETIATHKVQFAFHELRMPIIAMDAGFFIHSLNGFPMMYVKPTLQSIGIEGLLKLTEEKSRTCEFREVLAYVDKAGMKPKLFISTVKGTLAQKPSGVMHDKHWSELALIFIPENSKKTMADMNDEEYTLFRQKIDHDSHFEKFGKYLSTR